MASFNCQKLCDAKKIWLMRLSVKWKKSTEIEHAVIPAIQTGSTLSNPEGNVAAALTYPPTAFVGPWHAPAICHSDLFMYRWKEAWGTFTFKKKCKKNKLPPPTVVAEGKGEGTSKKFWAAQQKLSNRKIIHGAFGKDHSKCVPNSSRFKHLIELLVGLSFSAFLFFPWWYGSMQMSTDRHKQMTMDWPWVTKGNTMVSIDRQSLHCFAKLVATHVQMC